MILITIILFILLLFIYNYYIHYGKNGRLINQIPGPLTLPILGNSLSLYGSGEFQWLLSRRLCSEYHPIFKLWLFLEPFIIIAHPDYMETILNGRNPNIKGTMYKMLYPWMGTGLLTSAGAKWHSRRKILTPAFHFNVLRQFVDVLIKEGECLMKSLKEEKGMVVTDIVPLINEYTLNSICETAMGSSLQNLGPFQKRYRKAIHEMGVTVIYRLLRPWLYNDWLFPLTSMGKIQMKNLKILHGFTEKIIKERKQYHDNTNNENLKNFENDGKLEIYSEEKIGGSKKRLAMLDLLIAASRENQMNDDDIREEVDTFMFEGHDTVATGIIFALLLLAEHKDIQDNVRAEVNSVMQETGGKLTHTSLQNLSYLERCLKESLRMYPSVPFISRIILEDVRFDSYVVPAGTNVVLNIYDLHRDPDFWPDPHVFDPNRFLPDEMQNRHPYCYLPFSAGPRNCIGQRYALLEMKAMIAPLVHNFYLEPVDRLKDVRITMDIIYRSAQPLYVKFIPIENK